MPFTTLRCSYCRRKCVDYSNHKPVCIDHLNMKSWKQSGKCFIAICQLETEHLTSIIKVLVRQAKKDWSRVVFEEWIASAELKRPFKVRHEWMDFSHYLLEPLLVEAEKRDFRADDFG